MQSATSELDGIADVAVERLTWGRNVTESLLAGVPVDRLAYRAGGRGNHALWVMGHLALVDDQVLGALTGQPCEMSDEYKRLFEAGSEPTDDPADYPSRAELLDAMRAQRRRLIAWVETLDDAAARAPTAGALQGLAPDAISSAFAIMAHEMGHAGQVTGVRAALGLPRLNR